MLHDPIFKFCNLNVCKKSEQYLRNRFIILIEMTKKVIEMKFVRDYL